MTPTVFRKGQYRFFFYSREEKRPHIHVGSAGKEAKVWLAPVVLEENHGYNSKEINEILKIVTENRDFLLLEWGGHHGN